MTNNQGIAVNNGSAALVTSGDNTKRPARGTPKQETPYAWQSKYWLRAIMADTEHITNKLHGFAVYCAMCWIASDKGSPVFQSTKSGITGRSGVGGEKGRSLIKTLHELQNLGAI